MTEMKRITISFPDDIVAEIEKRKRMLTNAMKEQITDLKYEELLSAYADLRSGDWPFMELSPEPRAWAKAGKERRKKMARKIMDYMVFRIGELTLKSCDAIRIAMQVNR